MRHRGSVRFREGSFCPWFPFQGRNDCHSFPFQTFTRVCLTDLSAACCRVIVWHLVHKEHRLTFSVCSHDNEFKGKRDKWNFRLDVACIACLRKLLATRLVLVHDDSRCRDAAPKDEFWDGAPTNSGRSTVSIELCRGATH